MRELAQAYVNNAYGDVFNLLTQLKPALEMDMYISPHLTALYSLITDKIVVGYCTPYATVDMHKMVLDLKCLPLMQLESIIIALIDRNLLPFRIDSSTKIMYKKTGDLESDTLKTVFRVAKTHNKEMKSNILRLSVVKSQLLRKQNSRGDRRIGGMGMGGMGSGMAHGDVDYGSDMDMDDI